ncbi:MAG: polysaccharide biosynthesis tyrosine autokinase [Anaerolineaceae bacterium]|nr:polysaccharide biosynthesis tyrosine autokinase [Anaerolineaceae bacterium]
MELQPDSAFPQNETVDIGQYLAMLWHWLWLIVLVTIVAGVSAYYIDREITPVYSASTSVLVNEAPTSQSVDYTTMLLNQEITTTYAQMATKRPVLNLVIQKLKLDYDSDTLASMITVTPVNNTQLIDISVESTDPAQAAQIANTLVTVFSQQITDLQSARFATSKTTLQSRMTDLENEINTLDTQVKGTTDPLQVSQLEAKITDDRQMYSDILTSFEQVQLTQDQTTSTVNQIEPAVTPTFPIRPKVFQNSLLAAVVGMLLAIGVIFAIETLDDTVKTPDEITQQLGLPVLAAIMHFSYNNGKPVTEAQPRSPTSESFRTLRTNVQYAAIDHPLRSILITSAGPEEGKTTIATNLAIVMAHSGRRVTIVDADLRRPSIHKRLSTGNQIGLSFLFMQPVMILNGALQKTSIAGLSVITSGNIPPNPSELLGSQKMDQIIEKVKEESDIVLIDTPPALVVTDASVLAPQVDGVLIVIRPGVTKLAAAKQTVEQLHRVGANILGVVINNLELNRSKYGNYYARKYRSYTSYYYSKSSKYYSEEDSKPLPRVKPKEIEKETDTEAG